MKTIFDEAVDISTFDVGASQELKNNWKKADVFDL